MNNKNKAMNNNHASLFNMEFHISGLIGTTRTLHHLLIPPSPNASRTASWPQQSLEREISPLKRQTLVQVPLLPWAVVDTCHSQHDLQGVRHHDGQRCVT